MKQLDLALPKSIEEYGLIIALLIFFKFNQTVCGLYLPKETTHLKTILDK